MVLVGVGMTLKLKYQNYYSPQHFLSYFPHINHFFFLGVASQSSNNFAPNLVRTAWDQILVASSFRLQLGTHSRPNNHDKFVHSHIIIIVQAAVPGTTSIFWILPVPRGYLLHFVPVCQQE